ncbi:hypothetical protein S23_20740 [Bradyrhizobium cosmicum]|uniref:Uncharacterized protein n=1 Tax=Bradyrhizobium cosmicum TaxID=1404864 RepID=A0AAI8MBD7_9BRAD|nr:hypothetical protein S23_20740 [Bradyrhizobium cosmicum]
MVSLVRGSRPVAPGAVLLEAVAGPARYHREPCAGGSLDGAPNRSYRLSLIFAVSRRWRDGGALDAGAVVTLVRTGR